MRSLLLVAASWSLLLFAPAIPASPSSGPDTDRVQVPAELIRQLFADDASAAGIPKRPFKLEELAAVLSEPRFQDGRVGRTLTERYLKRTYPAGPTPVSSVITLDLPAEIQLLLFNAPAGSAQFSLPKDFSEALEVITRLEGEPRKALLAAASDILLAPSVTEILLDGLTEIAGEKYKKLVPFWGANIYLRNSGQEKYLSSSPTGDHALAGLLNRLKAEPVTYEMTVDSCTERMCKGKTAADSFGSMEFNRNEGILVASDDTIRASCNYSTMFRREFEDRVEIEIAVNGCDLLTINGESIDTLDGLLRDLAEGP